MCTSVEEEEDFYGGDDKQNENNKNEINVKTAEEIRNKLQEIIPYTNFEKDFGNFLTELHSEVSKFSNNLIVEYHVVIFNRTINNRFTILETKQGIGKQLDEDSKKNDFGVVGKLYSKIVDSDFLMIQYGYHEIEPVVYYKSISGENKGEICRMNDYQLSKFWTIEERKNFYWASSSKQVDTDVDGMKNIERKYAIAATLFYEQEGKEPVGAISLDFNTYNIKYPNFSFRQGEVDTIYKTISRMRDVIELMISTDIIKDMHRVIRVAQGEDLADEN